MLVYVLLIKLPRISCKVCVQLPVVSFCPLLWSHMKPLSLHCGQDAQWLDMLLTSSQHSSFKEELPKAQGFPDILEECQTSVLSHQLGLTAELVLRN